MKILLSLFVITLSLQAGQTEEKKLPDAATILDKFVEATGGAAAYRKFQFERIHAVMFLPGGAKLSMLNMRTRDGRFETVMETPNHQRTRMGVTNGLVWEISPSTGVRIASGEREKTELARHQNMDADDWRKEYLQAQTVAEETVNGKECYHVKLTRSDASVADHYYDKKSRLLVRQEEGSDGTLVVLDIDGWQKVSGITYASAIHMNRNGLSIPMAVDAAEFLAEVPKDALLLPKEVEDIRKQPVTSALPNPADLIDRYIEATGGLQAQGSITTQQIKATMTFRAQNMTAQIAATKASGGRSYMRMELPGAGLFEFGSDGKTRWQRSTLQGPQLSAQDPGSGLFGPAPVDVLGWKTQFEKLETVSKDQVDGKPCYFVKMKSRSGANDSDACFDVESGFLVKIDTFTVVNESKLALPLILKDYRPEGSVKLPHLMDMMLAGQAVTMALTEVSNNPVVDKSIFDLPEDVKALVDAKKKNGAK